MLVLAVAVASGHAAHQRGQIDQIVFDGDDGKPVVHIRLKSLAINDMSGLTGCSIAVVNEWSIRIDTYKGMAMLPLLKEAALRGLYLDLKGTDCKDWSDRARPHLAYIGF